jgi:hypothetical protein
VIVNVTGALVPVLLVAVRVPLKVPAVVGVPVRSPDVSWVSHAGNPLAPKLVGVFVAVI